MSLPPPSLGSFITSATASACRLPFASHSSRTSSRRNREGGRGAAAARRVRHASDRGDDGGDARGLTTTAADAWISPMPNSRRTRETLLPQPSLGISRGAPPSRLGGRRRRRRRRLCWRLRLVVTMPHVAPPPPLFLSALHRLLSAGASPPICLLHASPPVYLLFASWLSRRPCCCAASASQLCLDLFFAIWLSQLARPHLLCRRRLSSSSRLCLAMRRLRLSMRRHLTTGCVVAAADAQTSLPSKRRRLRRHHNC